MQSALWTARIFAVSVFVWSTLACVVVVVTALVMTSATSVASVVTLLASAGTGV